MAGKIAIANAEQLLIAQVETVRGLENVETIAAVDGIDVIWIGQADLTSSLGIPGQYAHPTFQKAVERIAAACRTHNKTLGYLALDVEDGKAMLTRGFRMLAYGGDLWLYQQAPRASRRFKRPEKKGRNDALLRTYGPPAFAIVFCLALTEASLGQAPASSPVLRAGAATATISPWLGLSMNGGMHDARRSTSTTNSTPGASCSTTARRGWRSSSAIAA